MADLRETRREQMFPQLNPAQVDRLEPFGHRERIRAGQVLAEPGGRRQRILVVFSGAIEIVLPGIAGETLVTVHTACGFAGELSSLRGAGSNVRARRREDAVMREVPVPNAVVGAIITDLRSSPQPQRAIPRG